MFKQIRRRLLVDPKVQGSLVRHAIVYWFCCIGTIEFLMLTMNIATGPAQSGFFAYFRNHDWQQAGVRILLSTLILAPIVVDMLRLSNRFAGPVFRIRRILRETAASGVVQQIHLRDDDYWHEFAEELNAAFVRVANAKSIDEPVASA